MFGRESYFTKGKGISKFQPLLHVFECQPKEFYGLRYNVWDSQGELVAVLSSAN